MPLYVDLGSLVRQGRLSSLLLLCPASSKMFEF